MVEKNEVLFFQCGAVRFVARGEAKKDERKRKTLFLFFYHQRFSSSLQCFFFICKKNRFFSQKCNKQ